RMTSDVDVLQEMFAAGAMTVLSDFVMLVWIVAIMLYINVTLALVSLALIPPMFFAINFFRHKARRTYRLIHERIAAHRDANQLSNVYEAALYSMVEAAGSVSLALLLWYGGGEALAGAIG